MLSGQPRPGWKRLIEASALRCSRGPIAVGIGLGLHSPAAAVASGEDFPWPVAAIVDSPALLIALGAAGVAALATVARWFYAARVRRQVAAQWQTFKDQVMSFSAQIDALRERHKLLTHLDQDFQTPMTGCTKAAYDKVARDLEAYRERWLGLMDAWQQAEQLLQAQGSFGTGQSRAARALVEKAGAPQELAALQRDCADVLTTLEQGHERARQLRTELERALHDLPARIAELDQLPLPTTPYAAARTALQSLAAEVQTSLEADPLGAVEHLTQAHQDHAALLARLQAIRECFQAAGETERLLAAVLARAAEQRSGGLLLQELAGNPDPHVETARGALANLRQALQDGDAEQAQAALAAARAALTDAQAAIDRQLAARSFCEGDLPARRQAQERLAQQCAEVGQTQTALAREFAPRLAQPSGAQLDQAAGALSAFEQRLTEVARLAARDVQHYVAAEQALRQLAGEQQGLADSLAAAGQRQAELHRLRAATQQQVQQVAELAARVDAILSTHQADRPQANKRYQQGRTACDQARQAAQAAQTDWEAVAQALCAAQADLEQAQKLAQEDIQLASQAALEVAAADREVARAREFSLHGVAPVLGSAESQLAQARAKLAQQAYEDAVRLADAAERTARTAYDEAVARVRQIQQAQSQPVRPAHAHSPHVQPQALGGGELPSVPAAVHGSPLHGSPSHGAPGGRPDADNTAGPPTGHTAAPPANAPAQLPQAVEAVPAGRPMNKHR